MERTVLCYYSACLVQLNCCGSSGPTDYHFSLWYNSSRPVDKLFVPLSCCLTSQAPPLGGVTPLPLTGSTPRRGQGGLEGGEQGGEVNEDMDLCQIDAIRFPKNKQPIQRLRTQVNAGTLQGVDPSTPGHHFEAMHQIWLCLFTFDARFFCLSAAQNAPLSGIQPAGGAFVSQTEKLRIKSK